MKGLKHLFLSGVILGLSFGLSLTVKADGFDPEIEVFEDFAYVQKFYKKLVKDNNIDTSFKFKQPALNGVLLGLSNSDRKTYFVATKDKVFSEHYKYYLEKDSIQPVYKNCDCVEDKISYTLMRCSFYDEYRFFEFKNTDLDGAGIISMRTFNSKVKNVNPEKIKFYSTGQFGSYGMD